MSIFKSLIGAIVQTVKALKGGCSLTNVLMELAMKIPTIIGEALNFTGADAEVKIDLALSDFDALTGSDEGALDLIKDMPAVIEEETLDAFKDFVGNIAKCKAKVPGYFSEAADPGATG